VPGVAPGCPLGWTSFFNGLDRELAHQEKTPPKKVNEFCSHPPNIVTVVRQQTSTFCAFIYVGRPGERCLAKRLSGAIVGSTAQFGYEDGRLDTVSGCVELSTKHSTMTRRPRALHQAPKRNHGVS
jgi:hypothetical protein